jgi:hypothetical protein
MIMALAKTVGPSFDGPVDCLHNSCIWFWVNLTIAHEGKCEMMKIQNKIFNIIVFDSVLWLPLPYI